MGVTDRYRPPVRTRSSTTDPERLHELVNAAYGDNGPIRLSSGHRPVSFGFDGVSLDGLTMDRVWNSSSLHVQVAPFARFSSVLTVRGSLALTSGGDEARLRGGECLRYSTEHAGEVDWDGAQAVVLAFPMAVVADVAAQRADCVVFEGLLPASPHLSRFWRASVAHVERELRAEDSALGHPLVEAETVRMLAAAALTVFPNTTMSGHHLRGPGWVAPAVVRRAVAFIDAHAGEPLTSGRIAEAAGIGVRGLQYAFARHLGMPPLAYARQVRLERAHRELVAADPAEGVTVRAVAARWGFARPDRFTAAYREAFGVLPSQSLRG